MRVTMTCFGKIDEALDRIRRNHAYGNSSSSKRIRCLLITMLIGSIIAATVLFVTLYTSSAYSSANYLGSYVSPSPLGIYQNAAVSTDGPGCASYGREILERNGTAMDAAISILLCMGVVIPESMGLGGGLFMVYYQRNESKAWVIDGRERAPAAATRDMFKGDKEASAYGGKSIAVPGEISAYHEAHSRFGRLDWSELFEGAIDIATNGFKIHDHLYQTLVESKHSFNGTHLGKIFTNPKTGKFYEKGEIMKRPDLVETFKILAEKGPQEFYSGEMGKNLVQEIQEAGGIITEKDLQSYQADVYQARNITLPNGLNLFSVDPPGSGPVLGFILNVLFRFEDLSPSISESLNDSATYYHRLVETFKYAFSLRAKLEDRSFGRVEKVMDQLLSDSYAESCKKLINDDQTYPPSRYGQVAIREDHGTSHVSVIDKDGNAASASSTVNLYYGSGIASPSTGLIFNDEMDDFSSPNITNYFGVPPSDMNLIEPGKKPLSSMVPSILVDGQTHDVVLSIGASGGTKITTSVALAIARNQLLKSNIKSTIDAARLHHQLYPNVIQYEDGFPKSILSELADKGHETEVITGRSSVVMAVTRDSAGKLTANSDYRKGGSVDGY